jgi:peptidyl-dipeptidase Dcp
MANPLLAAWETPFEAPPFDQIEPQHFRPAFDEAMAGQRREVEAVADSGAGESFADTIEALELSGRALRQVASVFFSLAGAHTNADIQAIERDVAPALARHRNWIWQNEAVFARIERLWERRDSLGLTPEQMRVLERYRTGFIRNGAALDADSRRRLGEITERLATWARNSARTCWPTNPRSGWCWRARTILPGCPTSSAMPRPAPPPTMTCPAST